MDEINLSLQMKALRYSESSDDYKLYRAALEWDLVDPIVIEKREDLKSEHQWSDKVEPYHHQVTNLITFCRRLPVTLLADDVGLGKTISAGLIASELISRGRISRILIICPKILGDQWKEELSTKFSIASIIVSGKELISAEPPEGKGAVITTYNSARLHLDKITKTSFDMLVLDEAHKLRNLYGIDSAPQVAKCFRQAFADRIFKYVLMLTATPIQNRLWDLYSLIDLLTVARGHENPFGSEEMFARKFIADNRTQARQLKPDAHEEFRSIIYGYMSRVRRNDANLHFPERIVQLHAVDPTSEEIELIETISNFIQELNRLAQISILQALISSPHALMSQLDGMAKKGTISLFVTENVREIVERISITAKLRGVNLLVDQLKMEQPEKWRMVIFTSRRETQATIQQFLEERNILCGLINGDSGSRNQGTISKFKKNPPEIHVIISTEAGSEGINLQDANVLVNYDLPWNPMIVEQRIGRIQRLSSEHASVCIFNIVLRNTFEEYIVGRLMEKLQMASHAIGDVEALLEASGMDEEDSSDSLEEKIRQLVMSSLAGKNVEEAIRRTEQSISEAKTKLINEEEEINALLDGVHSDVIKSEPRAPKLPSSIKSMNARDFVLTALKSLGANLILQSSGLYISELNEKRELIFFDNNVFDYEINDKLVSIVSYATHAAAFDRLVHQLANRGLHQIKDLDQHSLMQVQVEQILHDWINSFSGIFVKSELQEVCRCFSGLALIRARVSIAYDSYERLVEVICAPGEHCTNEGLSGLDPISNTIERPSNVGLITSILIEKVKEDSGITEFCRFYNERLVEELKAAGSDARKKKKLEDDFTSRLEFTLVGLEGEVNRQLKTLVSYKLESNIEYKSIIIVVPSVNEIINAPQMEKCAFTKKLVPIDCLGECEINKLQVLRHLLIQSEISGRMALSENAIICALSGKRVLKDEVEKSAITGRLVTRSLLKTSALSGKRAEPEFFAQCEFTFTEVLKNELSVSQISGKQYRIDEQLQSTISRKTGCRREFVFCSETNQPLLLEEADVCEVTGKIVMPGVLEKCEMTGKKVSPSELEKSTVTGKKALKRFFVTSSLSGARFLEQEALQSVTGKFCAPIEAKLCLWSGQKYHPDDLRICQLTGVSIHFRYATSDGQIYLEALVNLLNGFSRALDKADLWPEIVACAILALKNRHCKIEVAELSPDGQHIAICLEVRTFMGLKLRQAGFIYSIQDNSIVGRVSQGKRGNTGWILSQN